MATDYSDFYTPSGNYDTKYEYDNRKAGSTSLTDLDQRRIAAPEYAGGGLSGVNPLDALMEGLDAESTALTDKLKSIYDSYSGGAEKYGENMQPIIDGLEGDLAGLGEWMTGYQGLVEEMRPTFMGATQLDPNANRYREEYMGSVASQADLADQALKRDMASQGINPYENSGATRKMALDRNASLAGASNEAFRDWRTDYNRDIAQEQSANATYADMWSKTGDGYATSIDARTTMGGMYDRMYDSTLDAQKAKAAGYEGLTGLVEDRRSEALNLGNTKKSLDQAAYGNALDTYNSGNKQWEYYNG